MRKTACKIRLHFFPLEARECIEIFSLNVPPDFSKLSGLCILEKSRQFKMVFQFATLDTNEEKHSKKRECDHS